MLTIPVLYGSVRTERQGVRAARYVVNRLKARGHDAVLVDPAEKKLPLLDKLYSEYPAGEAPEPMEEIASLYRKSDGYMIISGEYNHNPPPALTNLINHFLEGYAFRPSAIVSYSIGGFGGVRAVTPLRSLLPAVGMPSLPTTLAISKVHQSLDEQGEPTDPKFDGRAEKFFTEFEWYARALKAARAQGTPS